MARTIPLKSSDGEVFEVEEAVAMMSQTIKHMIEDDCDAGVIPLPNVTSKILSKVIEYSKTHAAGDAAREAAAGAADKASRALGDAAAFAAAAFAAAIAAADGAAAAAVAVASGAAASAAAASAAAAAADKAAASNAASAAASNAASAAAVAVAKAAAAKAAAAAAAAELKHWDAKFVEVDQATLFDLILAANYLDIKGLRDLTRQPMADMIKGMIKGKTPEEIREIFNIRNDFTSEEEEEVRRENQWASE